MNFELVETGLQGAAREKCDVLVLLVPKNFKEAKDELSQLVAQALKAGDLEAGVGKVLPMYRPSQVLATRLVLASAGAGTFAEVRKAIVAALAVAKSPSMKKLVVCFGAPAKEEAVRAAILAVADATYVYNATHSKPPARNLQHTRMLAPNATRWTAAFDQSVATVSGVELAKEWANRPANHATPSLLAKAAQTLAQHPKISCEVFGPKEVEKLAMGAFLAVAQGSEEPLRFIVLRYTGAAKTQAPTVVIGKGITFDSGGISIKPAPEMDEMKFDMSGAASVLGLFKSLSMLKPAVNVVGLIPACENLINGRAVKPGDVVKSMSGQTIEILNTDAEGRLVLCDALTYAERFKPAAVVDIATLTGACVIALGAVRSGMFSSHDGLAQSLESASQRSQDLCWRMPLDDEYAEGLKTNFADVANVAGRAGGAITAAKFLQRFTDKFPWAHLDIAGSAWKSGPQKGATGRPVGLLLEFVMQQAKAK